MFVLQTHHESNDLAGAIWIQELRGVLKNTWDTRYAGYAFYWRSRTRHFSLTRPLQRDFSSREQE